MEKVRRVFEEVRVVCSAMRPGGTYTPSVAVAGIPQRRADCRCLEAVIPGVWRMKDKVDGEEVNMVEVTV